MESTFPCNAELRRMLLQWRSESLASRGAALWGGDTAGFARGVEHLAEVEIAAEECPESLIRPRLLGRPGRGGIGAGVHFPGKLLRDLSAQRHLLLRKAGLGSDGRESGGNPDAGIDFKPGVVAQHLASDRQ